MSIGNKKKKNSKDDQMSMQPPAFRSSRRTAAMRFKKMYEVVLTASWQEKALVAIVFAAILVPWLRNFVIMDLPLPMTAGVIGAIFTLFVCSLINFFQRFMMKSGSISLAARKEEKKVLGIDEKYQWEGLRDDIIELYLDEKAEARINYCEANNLEMDENYELKPGVYLKPDWLREVSKEDAANLKVLLLDRAIKLVHVFRKVDADYRSKSKLFRKHMIPAPYFESLKTAHFVVNDEFDEIAADAGMLNADSANQDGRNIFREACNILDNHGIDGLKKVMEEKQKKAQEGADTKKPAPKAANPMAPYYSDNKTFEILQTGNDFELVVFLPENPTPPAEAASSTSSSSSAAPKNKEQNKKETEKPKEQVVVNFESQRIRVLLNGHLHWERNLLDSLALDAEDATWSIQTQAKWAPKDRVIIDGLKAAAQHNGKKGIVQPATDETRSKGRIRVQRTDDAWQPIGDDQQGGILSVKPDNLTNLNTRKRAVVCHVNKKEQGMMWRLPPFKA